jgi:hypothetical protein
MVCSTFSRSGWSVVRSASLAKRDTSEKIPSPHLHKIPTRSKKVSSRTFQTALVCSSKQFIEALPGDFSRRNISESKFACCSSCNRDVTVCKNHPMCLYPIEGSKHKDTFEYLVSKLRKYNECVKLVFIMNTACVLTDCFMLI